MDNNFAEHGNNSFFLTLILGSLSLFTPEYIDITFRVVTILGTIIAATFTSRYYWYATKEKKDAAKRRKLINEIKDKLKETNK